jgi:hypothetical protein
MKIKDIQPIYVGENYKGIIPDLIRNQNNMLAALKEEREETSPCEYADKVGFCQKCLTTHHGKEEKCGSEEGVFHACQNPKGKCHLHDKIEKSPTDQDRHSITDKLIYEANREERERIVRLVKYKLGHDIAPMDWNEENIKGYSKFKDDLLKAIEE